MNKNDINDIVEDVGEISEDIEDIGKDTDKLLKQVAATLKELVNNTTETKSTKKWVITLFVIDKIVMLLLIYLGFKLSGV